MRSIVFNGHDFSEWCSAEVVARGADPIVADAYTVPGRAGALLISGLVPPQEVVVRVYLDTGARRDADELARIRARLRTWLCAPEGGELVLPDDPEVTYRDALLTYADGWDDLSAAAGCELTFTLFDPVGYGLRRTERSSTFKVGGTWPTYPTVRLVAAAWSYIGVGSPTATRALSIGRTFAGGEAVVIDCEAETVLINGDDARADISLGSDFFALRPGDTTFVITGASTFEVSFTERWL